MLEKLCPRVRINYAPRDNCWVRRMSVISSLTCVYVQDYGASDEAGAVGAGALYATRVLCETLAQEGETAAAGADERDSVREASTTATQNLRSR